MGFSTVIASVSATQSAPVRLPENAQMAFTCCAACPLSSYTPSQDAFWCPKFHSHYDGSDGCSKGPYG